MDQMLEDRSYFNKFCFARYATDVTFQREVQPTGSMQEGKVFFFGEAQTMWL